MESIYIIGASSLFNPLFYEYQQGSGHYFDEGFKNFGSIRYSLDGTLVLLEEMEDKWLPEHLAHESVTTYTRAEIKAFLAIPANRLLWELPDLI